MCVILLDYGLCRKDGEAISIFIPLFVFVTGITMTQNYVFFLLNKSLNQLAKTIY